MKKDKLTQAMVILAFVAVLGAAGFFGWKEIKKALQGGDKAIPLSGGVPAGQGGSDAGQEQVYTHPDYGFTLRYPGNLKLGKFPEGDGEIILLQGASAQEGFQIFISPYNETEEFSKEVILKADPKMKIENDKNIEIGGIVTSEEGTDKATTSPMPALSFDSSNEATSTSLSTGSATHEVWFVVDGNLYQATAFEQYGDQMERILQSLRFN